MVDRILAKRRPFTDSEKGYRDALIWHSTLEVASAGRTVLLTANTRDFAEAGDKSAPPNLASDLVDDIEGLGFPTNQVTLMTSTRQLLTQILPDSNESAVVTAAWEALVKSDEFLEQLNELLNSRMERFWRTEGRQSHFGISRSGTSLQCRRYKASV